MDSEYSGAAVKRPFDTNSDGPTGCQSGHVCLAAGLGRLVRTRNPRLPGPANTRRTNYTRRYCRPGLVSEVGYRYRRRAAVGIGASDAMTVTDE